jgi:hypothetical protein
MLGRLRIEENIEEPPALVLEPFVSMISWLTVSEGNEVTTFEDVLEVVTVTGITEPELVDVDWKVEL